jgi:hypothetical protein
MEFCSFHHGEPIVSKNAKMNFTRYAIIVLGCACPVAWALDADVSLMWAIVATQLSLLFIYCYHATISTDRA